MSRWARAGRVSSFRRVRPVGARGTKAHARVRSVEKIGALTVEIHVNI